MIIGIMGYGRAAKAVISVLSESDSITIEWIVKKKVTNEDYYNEITKRRIKIYSTEEITCEELIAKHPVNIILDFSSESGADYYLNTASLERIAVISAISNYSISKIAQLKKAAKQTCVFYSPNITIGVNFLMISAKILKKIAPHADITIIEEHFSAKDDISGTAKVIAKSLDIKTNKIKSIRAGGIVGTHEVLFGFPYQTVRIKHESIAREAFGNGARFALREIQKRTHGFYNMEDLVGKYFVDANARYAIDEIAHHDGRIRELITRIRRKVRH